MIGYKNNLKSHVVKNELINKIVEKVKAIPKYLDLKLDSELILMVCNIVENVINKGHKLNKKDIVIEVFKLLNFIGCDNDLKQLDKEIEFLHSNNKIKKIRVYAKVGLYVFDWIKRKFL